MCTEGISIVPASRNRPPGMTATTLCVPAMGPVFGAVAPPIQTVACIVANAGGGERPLATEARRLSVRPHFRLVCVLRPFASVPVKLVRIGLHRELSAALPFGRSPITRTFHHGAAGRPNGRMAVEPALAHPGRPTCQMMRSKPGRSMRLRQVAQSLPIFHAATCTWLLIAAPCEWHQLIEPICFAYLLMLA